jgi:hypothetical protein
MNDDFDAQLVSALRTLERDPVDDGRDAVARRVRRRHVRGRVVAVAAALVVGVGIGAVVANNDDPPRRVIVGQSGPSAPTAPPISPTATGVLAYPTTVAAGDEFSAVLRNPLSTPNTSCFIVVRLERWDGDSWGQPRELLPKGVDPNLAGPGADCAPDLIQPGAFIGERRFEVPDDLPPGDYRIVERSTEGEGRIAVVASDTDLAGEAKPTGRHSIDLAQGGSTLIAANQGTLERAAVLNDDKLAIAWHSACNAPARRIDFDYTPDRVTARLTVGAFLVTDCVGEPDLWSTVVDLPAPLWGRDVVVEFGDDHLDAPRVEVSPVSTFVLPLIEPGNTPPPIEPTSIFRQTPRDGSILLRVFGDTCVANAQSAVYAGADDTFYVQPRVQVVATSGRDEPCRQLAGWQSLEVGPVNVTPDSVLFGPA